MRRLSVRTAAAALVALLLGSLAPVAVGTSSAQTPTVRLIVTYKPGTSKATQREVSAAEGKVVTDLSAIRARVIEVPAAAERLVRKRLSHRSDVLAVEADLPMHASVTPDEPIFATAANRAPMEAVRLPQAWDITTGSDAVVIAIIDTGVSVVGAELPATKLVPGYNAINGGSNAADDNGHGTSSASVAAMVGNNGGGGAGSCWSCKVMPVKVLSSSGSGSTGNVAKGIIWAVDNGADVLSLSLSGGGTTGLKQAVDYAESRGVAVVAAAGNSGTTSTSSAYPAAYPSVLGIGGTGTNNSSAASNSNRGTWVKLAAPYTNAAIDRTGKPVWFSGTSSATPVVSGTIGLLLTKDSGLTAAQIRSRLASTAKKITMSLASGSGLLDARAALDATAWTNSVPTTTTTASTTTTTATTSPPTTTPSTTPSTTATTAPPTTATTAPPTGTTKTASASTFSTSGTVRGTLSVLAGPVTVTSCSTCTVEILNSSGVRQAIGTRTVTKTVPAGSYIIQVTGRRFTTISFTVTYTG